MCASHDLCVLAGHILGIALFITESLAQRNSSLCHHLRCSGLPWSM